MALTYALITGTTLSIDSSSWVTFSNIPQGFTDFVLRGSVRASFNNSNAGNGYYFQINGQYLSVASRNTFMANGSSVSVQRLDKTGNYLYFLPNQDSGTSASTYSNFEVYFPSYSDTSYIKPIHAWGVTENMGTTAYIATNAINYDSASAITSISIVPWDGNAVAGSSFYLYGIKKA